MTVEARDSGGPAKTNTATTRLVIKCANNILSNFFHYHLPRHWHFHHCIMIVITISRYRHYIILKAWRMWTTFHRSSRGKPTKASWHRTSAASETICRSVLKGLVQLFWSSFFYQKITPDQKDLLPKIWSSFSSWKDDTKRILRWRRWTWTRPGLRTATSATRSSRFTPHIRYL